MASTFSTLASFSSSSAHFMGPKVSIKKPSSGHSASMPLVHRRLTAERFRTLLLHRRYTRFWGFRWAPRVKKSRLLTGDWREFYTRTSPLTAKTTPQAPQTSSLKYMKLTLRCLILRNAPIMIERCSSGQGGPLPHQHPPHRCPDLTLLCFLVIRGDPGKLINVGDFADKV